MSPTIGTMRRVDPREIWASEDDEFTPWLVNEGIDLLSASVGLELGRAEEQVPAGQFRADVVCYDDSDTNHPRTVVIENQLRESDHDHLGKMHTYGAFLEADICIWVAAGFAEEHLLAVHFLNYPDNRLIDYYCVELHVAKFDDSSFSISFDTLVDPNDVAEFPASTSSTVPDDFTLNRFWRLLDEVLANQGLSKTIPGKNMGYRRFDIGFPGVTISIDRDVDSSRVGLRIYPTHHGSRTGSVLYHRLKRGQRSIDREIGEPVSWQRPNRHQNAVELSTASYLDDESMWMGEVNWMVERIETLRRVLLPRLGPPL